jgi:hypothetical protein
LASLADVLGKNPFGPLEASPFISLQKYYKMLNPWCISECNVSNEFIYNLTNSEGKIFNTWYVELVLDFSNTGLVGNYYFPT